MKNKFNKIAVIGGAGFVGSHIVDKLIELNYDVTVLDNLSSGDCGNINKKAAFYPCDIKDYNKLDSIFADLNFKYVFHLAAQINLRHSIDNPLNDAQENIIGTLNVLDNCVKYNVSKIIFTSTGGAIYSQFAMLPWLEKSEAKPESPYGLSKLTAENYIKFYSKVHGLNYVILRPSNIFGGRQSPKGEAGVISIFLDNINKNKDLIIFGSGKQTRDFIYVSDIVDASVFLLEKGHGTYNVSSNEEVDINTIADKLIKLTKSNVKIKYAEAIPHELFRSRLYSHKLEILGWVKKVSFDDGLKKNY